MIEAVMLWNEPNNLSHWNFELDPDWSIFSAMVNEAADAVKAERSTLPCVLGGMSPIDPGFLRVLQNHRVLKHMDAVAVHGFPLDWNHWLIDDWPAKLEEIKAATSLPVWVSDAHTFRWRSGSAPAPRPPTPFIVTYSFSYILLLSGRQYRWRRYCRPVGGNPPRSKNAGMCQISMREKARKCNAGPSF